MSATFFIDTNVFVYAVAEDSAYQAGAAETMEALGAGTASAVTSATVIEELWHLELRGRLPGLDGAADAAFTLMRPVLAVTDEIVAVAFTLKAANLGANDRIHAATCATHGIEMMLTADRGFDSVPGLRRVDPADQSEVRALLARS
jgi:uncharacterized protein